MKHEVFEAVEVFRRGGLILYPTDTVWGIGCDAASESAVARIYELKRSQNKCSMTVLAADADMVARYTGRVADVAWNLFDLSTKPLTLILPYGGGVAANLIPEQNTIGIRIPKHDFCQELLKALGRPIVSTSANISGNPTALRFEDIDETILKGVDLVVSRDMEGAPTGKPSSIMSITGDGEFRIIRE